MPAHVSQEYEGVAMAGISSSGAAAVTGQSPTLATHEYRARSAGWLSGGSGSSGDVRISRRLATGA